MKGKNTKIKNNNTNDETTVNIKPFAYSMSIINGKWKMHILFWLWRKEVLRYGELKKNLGNITHKMLSSELKSLEHDKLIIRKEYPQIPPKVEYSLSAKGMSLMPVLEELCKWGCKALSEMDKL